MPRPRQPIPGTTLFDGDQARKGYALNKMCFSFNSADNRAAFKADEAGYMARYETPAGKPAGITEANDYARAFARSRPMDATEIAHRLRMDAADLSRNENGLHPDRYRAIAREFPDDRLARVMVLRCHAAAQADTADLPE